MRSTSSNPLVFIQSPPLRTHAAPSIRIDGSSLAAERPKMIFLSAAICAHPTHARKPAPMRTEAPLCRDRVTPADTVALWRHDLRATGSWAANRHSRASGSRTARAGNMRESSDRSPEPCNASGGQGRNRIMASTRPARSMIPGTYRAGGSGHCSKRCSKTVAITGASSPVNHHLGATSSSVDNSQ